MPYTPKARTTTLPEAITEYVPYAIAIASVIASSSASAHALMYKRESRSAAAWVGLIWLSPFVGPALYALLGINRIRRKAHFLRNRSTLKSSETGHVSQEVRVGQLQRAVDQISDVDRLPGHHVQVLQNGDEAYPAMMAAIQKAEQTVHLCTYIFDADEVGLEFIDVLADAVDRGVDVRVLVDDLGARYSFPSVVRKLRRRGVLVARYGRSLWPWRMRYANLRNHRKILVIDGELAFAGGMNIRAGSMLARNPAHPTQDLHFRFEGPVVHQLDAIFAEDLELTTGKHLAPCPEKRSQGSVHARCLADGPDCPIDRIRWTMLSALACSKEHVRILTPYFVPDAGLITALCMAALRGVKVEIVLSEANNLRLVKWASQAMLWQVLERGCRVFMTPAPFDHSKLMLVDDAWCLVGSANWDARSLRLNFEVGVECEDKELATTLHAIVDKKLEGAHEVTLAEVDGRSNPVRFRDGVARLFSPYL